MFLSLVTLGELLNLRVSLGFISKVEIKMHFLELL